MADVYLRFQLPAAAIISVTMSPIHRRLERLAPATPEGEPTRTPFSYEPALDHRRAGAGVERIWSSTRRIQ